MPYVAIFAPGQEPQRIELSETTIIGRARECQVCIKDPNISRTHCKLEQVDGRWMLFDLASTNGTWLDAARVRRYALRDGETFFIGDSRIVFHVEKRIENRPEDPNEALRIAEIFEGSDSLSDTILHNRPRRPELRARPARHAKATCQTPPELRPASPLPFRRPRATPIVTAPDRRGWIHVVLQSLYAH